VAPCARAQGPGVVTGGAPTATMRLELTRERRERCG
jgi:hypothetical protein